MLQTPPIVSHTGVTASINCAQHRRRALEAVAKLGCVVGSWPSEIPDSSNIAPQTAMADAIEHVRRVAGIEHVAWARNADGC
jgi:microsomal dipeptidase-like Zn-dependent dipeptidase